MTGLKFLDDISGLIFLKARAPWHSVRACIYAVFGLMVLVAPILAQPLTESGQQALLDQGNRAFEQALDSTNEQQAQGYYRQAIEAYQQLLTAGVHNAKLHYNLGNAYFLHHDLGRAILHYRRGLQLEPANQRLRANLRYARSQRLDQIDPSAQRALVTRLLFWHDDIGLQTQVTLALIGFLLAWGGAFAHLVWRRPFYLWCMAAAAFGFVLLASSALVVHAHHATARHGVVVVQETPVRKGNGASYALQFPQPLHSGAEFLVQERRGSWLHIRLDNGARGWIRHAHAELW
jgi:tetratricopeptide (TPR) repeat protein